jgi:hypothetical protein
MVAVVAGSYIVVIGERSALAWVLTAQRMAFPEYRAREAAELKTGDELFLYTTRGCFHNPGRDRGRIIGTAKATSGVESLEPPFEVAGRSFGIGCQLALVALAPYGEGIELPPLVDEMETFPNKAGWTTRMRRPLVPIPRQDAVMLRRLLRPVMIKPQLAVDGYLAAVPRAVSPP